MGRTPSTEHPTMTDLDPAAFADHLAAIRTRIDAIERPYGHRVEILPVTKGFTGRAIQIAAAAGCRSVGENYAQDLLSKRAEIDATGVAVHFIGQLQSNKVRQLADVVRMWESLDRRSIIDEVARRAAAARVLIQVNATGEPNKGGCAPADVEGLVAHALDCGLDVAGLMTVGPTDANPPGTAEAFDTTRRMVDELDLDVCSMGMSGDIDAAVRAGSTQVRIGSALFGPRPTR